MSNMNFNCDVCGREIFGCTFVNGMKFCAKCYQETFGNQKKYVDMLHKETGELLVNLLAEKDKQIAELQKQLEEKERLLQYGKTEIKKLHKRINDIVKRDEKLFKSQPAEIVEKIKEQIFNHFNVKNMEEYESLSLLDSLFTADAVNEILDAILKEYQK